LPGKTGNACGREFFFAGDEIKLNNYNFLQFLIDKSWKVFYPTAEGKDILPIAVNEIYQKIKGG